MDIQNKIHGKIEERKQNIMKSFVDNSIETNKSKPDEIEKARQVGETKVGKDGITRVWKEIKPGVFDWRRTASDGSSNSEDKKEASDDKEKNMLDRNIEFFQNQLKGAQAVYDKSKKEGNPNKNLKSRVIFLKRTITKMNKWRDR